ncbi:hypothetical protein KP509_13G094000 [Ceratopteris richardii]|uniref:Uncharacterized protein n=1 Tax=Ceratopteris richardii TaxID=49495 RepID=A0A8T2TI33_CERRI|nr:hypothetical protein KP509_13G094000 [Ceratopteris richardii]
MERENMAQDCLRDGFDGWDDLIRLWETLEYALVIDPEEPSPVRDGRTGEGDWFREWVNQVGFSSPQWHSSLPSNQATADTVQDAGEAGNAFADDQRDLPSLQPYSSFPSDQAADAAQVHNGLSLEAEGVGNDFAEIDAWVADPENFPFLELHSALRSNQATYASQVNYEPFSNAQVAGNGGPDDQDNLLALQLHSSLPSNQYTHDGQVNDSADREEVGNDFADRSLRDREAGEDDIVRSLGNEGPSAPFDAWDVPDLPDFAEGWLYPDEADFPDGYGEEPIALRDFDVFSIDIQNAGAYREFPVSPYFPDEYPQGPAIPTADEVFSLITQNTGQSGGLPVSTEGDDRISPSNRRSEERSVVANIDRGIDSVVPVEVNEYGSTRYTASSPGRCPSCNGAGAGSSHGLHGQLAGRRRRREEESEDSPPGLPRRGFRH